MTDLAARRAQGTGADSWLVIEHEAREQVRAELTVAENTPLEFGAWIAWAECLYGRTDGFSPLHRVGFPADGYAFTSCGEVIPEPIRWRVLSAAIIRTTKKCQFCEAEATRLARESAA